VAAVRCIYAADLSLIKPPAQLFINFLVAPELKLSNPLIMLAVAGQDIECPSGYFDKAVHRVIRFRIEQAQLLLASSIASHKECRALRAW